MEVKAERHLRVQWDFGHEAGAALFSSKRWLVDIVFPLFSFLLSSLLWNLLMSIVEISCHLCCVVFAESEKGLEVNFYHLRGTNFSADYREL